MEFNSPIELYNWMHKNISYKHTGKFLSVEEVMKNKYGDCHDQANFACHYLTKMGLKCGRLFMVEYNAWNSPGGATHTLVYFIQNNKYYWFENAWGNQSGIHKPFNTLQELKDDIASKWNYSGKNTKLYMSEYKSVKPGSNLNDYVMINTPENDPKKYYSKDKDEIKMNSKVLENFLIPEVATESISKENLKNAAKGIAIAAIMAFGAKAMIHDYKNKKEIDKFNKEKEAKNKSDHEAYQRYLNSQEHQDDINYVNKKYGINYINISDSDKKNLESKLNAFILADLKKMANSLNKNKKLCNELANKYIEFQSKDDPKYRDIATKEAEEIRTGPAIARQSEYAYEDENEFDVCDADQSVIIFMIDYIQEPFCNAINEKYAKEIKLGIMSKMKIVGDGDEGIIGYDFHYNDFKR